MTAATWMLLALTASATPNALAFSALYPTGCRLMPVQLRSHPRALVPAAGSIAPGLSPVSLRINPVRLHAGARLCLRMQVCVHARLSSSMTLQCLSVSRGARSRRRLRAVEAASAWLARAASPRAWPLWARDYTLAAACTHSSGRLASVRTLTIHTKRAMLMLWECYPSPALASLTRRALHFLHTHAQGHASACFVPRPYPST